MAIKYAPDAGSILLCEYNGKEPEMTKKRPVVVLACVAHRLCIVAPLSTSEPEEIKAWHYQVSTPNPLPPPYNSLHHWLKGDMVSSVSFDRLTVPHKGKDSTGHRKYVRLHLSRDEMSKIRRCVASAIGISPLDFQAPQS